MSTSFNAVEVFKARKVPFFLVLFLVVFSTYGILYIIDFIPEDSAGVAETTRTEVVETNESGPSARVAVLDADPALPVRMIIDALDREIAVLNPQSNTIADLDTALLSGAVRHPDSALIGGEGNVFILGHSSYLPVVRNKNFQVFNDIEELEWGDTIRLQSEDREFVYRVDRIYEAKASEVRIPTGTGVPKLTLATCNSFGSKEDRFIVEASLVDSYEL